MHNLNQHVIQHELGLNKCNQKKKKLFKHVASLHGGNTKIKRLITRVIDDAKLLE